MKCRNCGHELSDGMKICPKCGTRQNNNFNRKNSKGRFFNFRLLGIVVGAFAILVLSIFFIFKNQNKKEESKFTHNISFNKDRLSVIDENTIRYREVPENQTFTIGSSKGFVDVVINDETGNRADYLVSQTEKFDRYIIKPNNKWDSSHTYYLSLGNDTYFTDEDMYKFNKIIYTIKRLEIATYKYSENIKNLVDNPNTEVNEGDIIIFKDESGQSICKKVVSINNGIREYETPDLAEVFEELNLNTTIKPDFKELLSDKNVQNQMMHNFVRSSLFEYFVMTTYAEDIKNSVFNIEEQIANTEVVGDVGNSATDQLMKNFKIVVENDEMKILQNWEIKFNIETSDGNSTKITLTATLKDNGSSSETDKKSDKLNEKEHKIELAIDISKVEIKPDIDVSKDKFDLVVYNTIGFNIKYNFDFDGKVTKNMKKEKEEVLLFNLPIASGLPCVYFYFNLTFEPELGGEFKLTGSYNKIVQNNYGLTKSGAEFKGDGLDKIECSNNDIFKFDLDGKVLTSASIKPEVGVKFCLIPDGVVPETAKRIKTATLIERITGSIKELTDLGHVSVYAKGGVFAELEGKFAGEIQPGNIIVDLLGAKNLDSEYVGGSIELSLGVGVDYKVVAEGELRLGLAKLSDEIELMKNKVYLLEYNKKEATSSNADKVEVKNVLDIGGIGSKISLNGKEFVVLDQKDIKDNDGSVKEKRALVIATNGFESKYNDWKQVGNNSLGSSWKKSSLRDYLNKGYIDSFSDVVKTSVCEVEVVPEGSIQGQFKATDIKEESTEDQVFILSYNEYNTTNSIGKKYLDYLSEENNDKYYWVRNSGRIAGTDVALMQGDKKFVTGGKDVTTENIFVRPAMWIRYWMKEEEVSQDLKEINKGTYLNGYANTYEWAIKNNHYIPQG